MNTIRRRFTDKQEADIRRRIFKAKEDPRKVMAELKISNTMMYRILGGPIKQSNPGIEATYGV